MFGGDQTSKSHDPVDFEAIFGLWTRVLNKNITSENSGKFPKCYQLPTKNTGLSSFSPENPHLKEKREKTVANKKKLINFLENVSVWEA